MTDENKIYDLFISHRQYNGGQLALCIKLLLKNENPNLAIFLDVDDMQNIHDLEKNIKNSKNVLLLITEGVFERPFIIQELNTALEYNKNIIVLWDKINCPIFPSKKTVPKNIINILDIRAIIWSAEIYHREGILTEISKLMKTKTDIITYRLINKEKEDNNTYIGIGGQKVIQKCWIRDIEKELCDNFISVYFPDDNLSYCKTKIKGPINSIFQDNIFILEINFPYNFPFRPPKVRFENKIYHPNIDFNTGEICLNILGIDWGPILYRPQPIMLSICSLLGDPNLQDSINIEAAEIFLKDQIRYNAIVEIYVRLNKPVEIGLGLSRKSYIKQLLILKNYIDSTLYSDICELFNDIKSVNDAENFNMLILKCLKNPENTKNKIDCYTKLIK